MKIIDDTLLNQVADEAKKSPRIRMNYNFHQSLQDKCHRLLNALEPGTQISVHHHPTKAETFVILKGKARVTTYNDDGEVLKCYSQSVLPQRVCYGLSSSGWLRLVSMAA